MKEIRERIVPKNTMLAVVEGDEVIGWGCILAPEYEGNVFGLHPLAVREDQQGRGLGRAIIEALANTVREEGGFTIWLGANDGSEDGEISLADADLYDNLPAKLANFGPGTQQSGFYFKMEYKIIGVTPDATAEADWTYFWERDYEYILVKTSYHFFDTMSYL